METLRYPTILFRSHKQLTRMFCFSQVKQHSQCWLVSTRLTIFRSKCLSLLAKIEVESNEIRAGCDQRTAALYDQPAPAICTQNGQLFRVFGLSSSKVCRT